MSCFIHSYTSEVICVTITGNHTHIEQRGETLSIFNFVFVDQQFIVIHAWICFEARYFGDALNSFFFLAMGEDFVQGDKLFSVVKLCLSTCKKKLAYYVKGIIYLGTVAINDPEQHLNSPLQKSSL